jgi:uncharacterized protein (DUF2267 family)
MSENFEKTAEQAAAFQKIWMESMSKVMQTAFTIGPNSPPPDVLHQIRSGIFQALAQSWEEFMRSPQFLESMKQWMDNAINFRKMSNDFMAKVRNEMQAPSRDDIDTVMLTVRHIEKRLLDRMEDLTTKIDELNNRLDGRTGKAPGNAASRLNAARKGRKATRGNSKVEAV